MRKKMFINSLLVGLVSFSAMSQAQVRPKLVVGIVIDQLQTEYIDYLKELFGEKGFRRLINNGLYIKDLDFSIANPDRSSGSAIIYTGAYPNVSAVAGNNVFNPATKRLEPTMLTADGYSPVRLALSTISDEIAIDGIGLSAVYSIACDPSLAVIMGGHAATSAVWLDENNGLWKSSNYYTEFPLHIKNLNSHHSLPQRIDTIQWKPLLPLSSYPGIPAQKRYYPFRHTYPSRSADSYKLLSESPMGNREVTTAAIQYLTSLHLGNRADAIDMLNVGYSAAPCRDVKDGDYRLELQDSYLRLDLELARLFDAIQKNVGLENTLVFVVPTGYYDNATIDDPKYRIPTGDFSTKRAAALLNSFLSARYGTAEYVNAIAGNSVYFNHSVIDKNSAGAQQIIASGAEFLSKMSGVADVYTLSEILSSSSPEMRAIRIGIDAPTAGDIMYEVNPGWNLVDDFRYPTHTKSIRKAPASTPAFIFYPGVEAETISTPVSAAAIAPTVTKILRIRSPNGATLRPLR